MVFVEEGMLCSSDQGLLTVPTPGLMRTFLLRLQCPIPSHHSTYIYVLFYLQISFFPPGSLSLGSLCKFSGTRPSCIVADGARPSCMVASAAAGVGLVAWLHSGLVVTARPVLSKPSSIRGHYREEGRGPFPGVF